MHKTMFYQRILRPRWAEMRLLTKRKWTEERNSAEERNCAEDKATDSKESRFPQVLPRFPATKVVNRKDVIPRDANANPDAKTNPDAKVNLGVK